MSIKDDFDCIQKHLRDFSAEEIKNFYIDQSLLGFLDHENHAWKNQLFRNNVHFVFLLDFLNRYHLRDNVTVLKGVALLDMDIYENLGQRLTGDIDLLVKDFTEIEEALNKEKFKLIESKTWKGNDFKKVYQKTISGIEVAIELHSRLFYHVSFDEYEFTYSINGLKILSREWMLMHLVGHLAFQHTFLKIHWLIEVHTYLKKYKADIDWKKFFFLIDKFQFKNSWKLTEIFIALTFHGKIPDNLLKRQLFNIKFILFPEKQKFRYYVIKFLTKDNPMTFVSYAFHWTFSCGWKK